MDLAGNEYKKRLQIIFVRAVRRIITVGSELK